MSAFFISFSLIFLAELGDKSQLVALWFATRYRWWLVIAGVTVATLVVHLGSTAIGSSAADLLPEPLILAAAGVSFYAFAVWGLMGDTLSEEGPTGGFSGFGVIGLITTAFFLSELGDKTQLATISIAGKEQGFLGVWLGSTMGMVAADALAIAVGVIAGKKVPLRATAIASAALFVIFGTIALARAVTLAV
jgi:putative Ca2+/H+ antiporter (TMEM165/GDT1 family)